MANKNDTTASVAIIGGTCLVSLLITLLLPRIPQPVGYHDFADKRTLFGIPHFLNVASNLPLIAMGVAGLVEMKKRRAPELHSLLNAIFASTIATGIGSAIYHLMPNHTTLLLDRIPMSVLFAAIAAFTVAERINLTLGHYSFGPLAGLGLLSNIYWLYSEKAGVGDVRYYGLMQTVYVIIGVLSVFMFSQRYTRIEYWYSIFGFFALAKVCEMFDKLVYYATLTMIGGHPLKHLFAAVSMFFFLRYVRERRPIEQKRA